MNTIRLLLLVGLLISLAVAAGFGQQLGARWTEHETALAALAAVGSVAACATPVTLVFAFVLWQATSGGGRRRAASSAPAIDGQWRELPPAAPAPPMFVDATGSQGSGLALPAQAQESWRA